MPYITQEARKPIRPIADVLVDAIENEGELNYAITLMCKLYADKKGICYSTYNTIIGVLDCAKQEFYRMEVAPYEDIKIETNGLVD